MTTLHAHWYMSEPNFGDLLTPALLDSVGIRVKWAKPEHADIFAVGSLAQRIPVGYRGIVWGSGKMWEGRMPHLELADIRALRGPLTAAGIDVEVPLYADPGLLAPRLVPDLEVKPLHQQGVAPHYADKSLDVEGLQIDMLAGIAPVVRQVASCRALVTSSLHAIILADAIGIPSMWVPSDRVVGGGFKFHDYAASYGLEIEPYRWWQPDRRMVLNKITGLLESLRALAAPRSQSAAARPSPSYRRH